MALFLNQWFYTSRTQRQTELSTGESTGYVICHCWTHMIDRSGTQSHIGYELQFIISSNPQTGMTSCRTPVESDQVMHELDGFSGEMYLRRRSTSSDKWLFQATRSDSFCTTVAGHDFYRNRIIHYKSAIS